MTEIEPVIDVIDVEVLSRYILKLTFEDGAVKVLDVEPMLDGEMFEPLLNDYRLFTEVQVDPDAGTIVWPNGADMSPRSLYARSKVVTPA